MMGWVQATHFRFGTTRWEQTPGKTGRRFVFDIDSAWRRTYYNNGNVAVGGNIQDEYTSFFPDLNFKQTFSLVDARVNVVNAESDWLIARQQVIFEYSSDGVRKAGIEGCCRISTLLYNAQADFKVANEFFVTAGRTAQSIRTTAVPIVTMLLNKPSSFSIPAIGTGSLRYRLSDGTEASTRNSRTYRNPDDLKLDWVTGIVSWVPKTLGYQSVQVTIDQHSEAPTRETDRSKFISSTAVDFLLNVIGSTNKVCKSTCSNKGNPCASDSDCLSCTGTTPSCSTNSPPVFSAYVSDGTRVQVTSNNAEISVPYGKDFSLVVEARDEDSDDKVTVGSTGVPAGATTSVIVNNPGSHRLSWKVTFDLPICYTAVDSLGNSATGQFCIKITPAKSVLSANGNCLTKGVAGQTCSFNIINGPNLKHVVEIVGPSTSSAQVTWNNNNYVGTYNVRTSGQLTPAFAVTKAGFYAMTIKEDGGSSLVYSLEIAPAETDPAKANIYESGSTGLSGGLAGADVFFFIQSKDTFDNVISEQRQDAYYATIGSQRINAIWDTSNLVWRISYKIPSSGTSFTLQVFYKSGTSIRSFTPSVIPKQFNIVVDMSNPVTAGTRVSVSIVADDNTRSFSVNLFGTSVLATSIGNNRYTAQSPSWIQNSAGTYIDALVIDGPGLAATYKKTVVVIPADPFPAMFSVTGLGLTEAEAGRNSEITVQIRDRFGNRIDERFGDISYTFTFAGTPISGKADYVEDGRYQFVNRENRAGIIDLSIVFDRTNQKVAASDYKIAVSPSEFSVVKSIITTQPRVEAGNPGTGILAAFDRFSNRRRAGDDRFDTSFKNEKFSGDAQWRALRDNTYALTYSSTKSGHFKLNVKVFVPSENALVPMQEVAVVVFPGPADLGKCHVGGAGLSKGVAEKPAQLLIQLRDQYENVVHGVGSSNFVVKVTSSTGVDSFWKSQYSAPTQPLSFHGLEAQLSRFSTLQKTLTADEQLLAPDGYFWLDYTVPKIASSNKFKITIYWYDKGQFSDTEAPESIAASTQAKEVYTGEAEADVAGPKPSLRQSLRDRLSIILPILFALIIAALMAAYALYRSRRYRPKYLLQKQKAADAERALMEMAEEIDVIPGSRPYEAVGAATVSANPLHPLYSSGSPKKKDLTAVEDPNDVKMKRALQPIRHEFKPQRPGAM